MSETPKEKPLCDLVEPSELEKEDSWEEDQKKRGYYYDDAHGYEVYVPDEYEDNAEATRVSKGETHMLRVSPLLTR